MSILLRNFRCRSNYCPGQLTGCAPCSCRSCPALIFDGSLRSMLTPGTRDLACYNVLQCMAASTIISMAAHLGSGATAHWPCVCRRAARGNILSSLTERSCWCLAGHRRWATGTGTRLRVLDDAGEAQLQVVGHMVQQQRRSHARAGGGREGVQHDRDRVWCARSLQGQGARQRGRLQTAPLPCARRKRGVSGAPPPSARLQSSLGLVRACLRVRTGALRSD